MLSRRLLFGRRPPRRTITTTLVVLVVGWICYESRRVILAAPPIAPGTVQIRTAAAPPIPSAISPPPSVNAPEATSDADDPPLKLYLPKVLYAYPGLELRIPFENIVTPTLAERLFFKVNCAGGSTGRRCWTARFTPEQVGAHPFELIVSNFEGKELLRGTSEVRVAPIDAGAGKSLRVLIVGDSVTHATLYPNRVDQLFATPNNPRVTWIGTNHYMYARPGVVHEGYNGWTWLHFLRYNDPGKGMFGAPDKSPILFLDADQHAKLDIPRYLRETSPDGPPDLVMFELGINDVFQQFRKPNPNDIFILDEDSILRNAQQLVQAFREAVPHAALAIWLTQPVNASQDSFAYAYRAMDDFRKLKRSTIALRQHQFAARLAECFGEREQEGIFLVPMSATVDPVEDYPPDNAVHPSVEGYSRIGDSIYAWVKCWLAGQSDSASRLQAIPAGISSNQKTPR